MKQPKSDTTYQKLWSLNPDLHKTIGTVEAVAGYTEYLKYEAMLGNRLDEAKTFTEWLEAEI